MCSSILNERLPSIELSYGTKLHRKVHADLYQIIPKGKKCLVWYTYWNEHNVCYLLHLDKTDNHIHKVEKMVATFSNELCYGKGTIVCGTLFHHRNVKTFAIVDLILYKGRNLQNCKYQLKLEILSNMLKVDIKEEVYISTQLLVASCVLTKTYNEAITMSKSLPYNVYSIQPIKYNLHKCLGFYTYNVKPSRSEAIFKIKPHMTCDIYELYVRSSSQIHGYAAITDYKSSVMMNNIFRNIKENKNIDLIEESEEENDFENINPDKYVYLNEIKIMRCVYMPQFNKWKPLSVCPSDLELSSKEEVITLEKKYNKVSIYDTTSNISKSTPHRRIL